MATPLVGNKNDFSQEVITDAQADAWSDQSDLLHGALSCPLAHGLLRADFFTLASVAGSLQLDILSGTDGVGYAVVGEAANEIPVRQIGTVRIGADQGITASATNHIFLKRAPSVPSDPATWFVANTTGTRPANTTKVGTAVFGTTDATSVDYTTASGRIHRTPASIDKAQTWAGLQTFGAGIAMADGQNIVLGTGTGTKIGTSISQKLGLWNAAPIARPTGFTQTYATADKTLSAYTANVQSSAYTGAADGEAKLADLNSLRGAYENLRAFAEDLAQLVNALIDDDQALGLRG
jgi:hypothetical protein